MGPEFQGVNILSLLEKPVEVRAAKDTCLPMGMLEDNA